MHESPLPLPVLPSTGRRFHVMAKPVGALCNLNCAYCYYLSKERLGDGIGNGRMSDEVLDAFVRDYIDGQDSPTVQFAWQGGEPTLLGLDFYRKVVALQAKHCPPGKKILNDLQTNGTLLDEEWCRFLKTHQFLVGLSIDGPRELHDAYRISKNQEPTFDRVVGAHRMLRKHGVPVNTLTVVNSKNVSRPLDVYRFLVRQLKSNRVQFIPCVEPKSFTRTAPQFWPAEEMPVLGAPAARPGTVDSVVTDWSVDAEEYGAFLCRVFDEWRAKGFGKIFVNLFETLFSQHLGRGTQLCVFGEVCGKATVVEQDGSLYSCDHYVYPEYRLGNIRSSKLADMAFSNRQISFGMAKATTLPQYCRRCSHLSDCWGECPKNRFLRTPDGEPGLNYLCPGLKRFFDHAMPTVNDLVGKTQRGAR